jgi:transcription initiation factor TFIIIB Brf1 subunit/transcription initiation factor TFIIB
LELEKQAEKVPVTTNTLILQLIRERASPEIQRELAYEISLCLNCGVDLLEKDGEIVCPGCGEIWGKSMAEEGIPFEASAVESGHAESNYSPGCALAFGSGLGSFIPVKSLYRILAAGSSGNKDLPLRVSHTRILVNRLDHPFVQTLLGYGSALCKDFGLHDGSDLGVKFAEAFGHALRKVAGFYVVRGESQAELHVVAKGIFLELYSGCFPEKAEKVRKNLQLSQDDANFAGFLLNALTRPRKKQKKPKGQD